MGIGDFIIYIEKLLPPLTKRSDNGERGYTTRLAAVYPRNLNTGGLIMALKSSRPVVTFSILLSTLPAFAENDYPPINHQYDYTENDETFIVKYERSKESG